MAAERSLRPVEPAGPPHDLGAEAAVLSACLLSPEAFDDVADLVRPDRFFSEAHRWIWASIEDLHAGNRPVDVTMVGTWLREKGRIEQIGGLAYLTEILGATPAIPHARAHAQVVHDCWRRRELLLALRLYSAEAQVGSKPTQQLLDESAAAVAELATSREQTSFATIGALVVEVVNDAQRVQEHGVGAIGLPTGFDRYDRMTCGLHDGELTVIAARPGMGKTAIVTGIAVNVAMEDPRAAVVVFSVEMPKKQIAQRIAAAEARIDLNLIRTGSLPPSAWSRLRGAEEALSKIHLHIDDTAAVTLAAVRSKLRRLANEERSAGRRLRLVCVDYLQIMGSPGARSREEEVAQLSAGLKAIAKDMGVPLIALSQLNRALDQRADKRPQLSDLRSSGAIEQDADNVAFLHREAYYKPKSLADRNIAEIIIAKQRNGPTGTVKVHWEGYCARFNNLADTEYPDDDTQEREAS
jgi:replicative DNA helicase